MTLGTSTQAYGDPSYWNNRYTQEPGPFDWYQKYPDLAPLLNLYIPRNHRILVVGCGNAALSEGMVDDGYRDVVNIDISSVVIEAMQKKCHDRPELKYITMDVRDMSGFQTGSFGAVIDKAYGSGLRSIAFNLVECHQFCAEKLVSEKSSEHQTWELTNPIPLDNDSSSVDAALGKNPEVHYIYVCTKAFARYWKEKSVDVPDSGNARISGMLLKARVISSSLKRLRVSTYLLDSISASNLPSPSNPSSLFLGSRVRVWTQFSASISSLKVVWRKDRRLDEAIENDKVWRLCSRVVKEVLNEPGQVIPLRYLEKRRERMRLKVKITTFLNRNPGLFDIYLDRIKPKTEPVRFLRVSDRLRRFLDEEKRIKDENEPLLVEKLCKLLMMSRDNVVSADKLVHVKREFGFPDDFLCSLVPKYPEFFRLVGSPGEGKSFLELVSWNHEFAQSVIERRAEEDCRLTGIGVRPSFNVQLPSGFFLRKEMREWVRDWMELPYVSPYAEVSHLDQASPEMEKRTVGVFHELLSLSILKRMPVPILGKFSEEYRFSNAFASVFTRHSGIFYLSLKGGIKTAMLREAYQNEELIDRDPVLAIKDRFVELLAEGHRERAEQLRLQREAVQKDLEIAAIRNVESGQHECDENL
ncbi:hypothetical protein HHK36_012165 [Tetracentron sinense]|uniref:Uncharacterized protein n=1 Tax=Tetracentron sinense TaxID=13715 RepID=A0A834Z5B4_TETSI|nr:hypothetical protein HHK36_012165 [Tetracentron sinense]